MFRRTYDVVAVYLLICWVSGVLITIIADTWWQFIPIVAGTAVTLGVADKLSRRGK